MKIENIKTEFPIFDEKIQNNDLVYLDSANSSQKPKVVADDSFFEQMGELNREWKKRSNRLIKENIIYLKLHDY